MIGVLRIAAPLLCMLASCGTVASVYEALHPSAAPALYDGPDLPPGFEIGAPCEVCGEGVWKCENGQPVCEDPRVNECGGCGAVPEIGAPCGVCRAGRWECVSTEEAVCEDYGDTGEVVRYVDGDQDGWGGEEILRCPWDLEGTVDLSGDCQDSDPAVHPESAEICGNGVDEDCVDGDFCPGRDGARDFGAADIIATYTWDTWGIALADMNRDGLDDLVTVGQRLRVFYGPFESEMDLRFADAVLRSPDPELPYAWTCLHTMTDPATGQDVIVTAIARPGERRGDLVALPEASWITSERPVPSGRAVGVFPPQHTNACIGVLVDGTEHLAIASVDEFGVQTGRVLSPTFLSAGATDLDTHTVYRFELDSREIRPLAAVDTDGDGNSEMIWGSPFATEDDEVRGRVDFFSLREAPDVSAFEDSDFALIGTSEWHEALGSSAAVVSQAPQSGFVALPDQNGLWVAEPVEDQVAPLRRVMSEADLPPVVLKGIPVASVDIDGDGVGDILSLSFPLDGAGRVSVTFGSDVEFDALAARSWYSLPGGWEGGAVALTSLDMNYDGLLDLVVWSAEGDLRVFFSPQPLGQ